MPTRISSAKASSPARGCTTWTRSSPSLRDRVPENTLLSHDLFEGLYARTALVTDVEVVDDYPSSVLAHAKRQHRWVRGDWQIFWWLWPVVPTRVGWRRNRLPLIARWKIFDNLRRSLTPPATLAWLIAGWLVLPGSPLVWTAVVLAVLAFPAVEQAAALLGTIGRTGTWRAGVDDLRLAGARAVLQTVFLASQAYDRLHAIIVTLVRVGVTRQRLLEWETAAVTADRAGARAAGRVREADDGQSAPGGRRARARLGPASGGAAGCAAVLLLWIAAPAIAFVLSRPAVVPPRGAVD